MRAGVVLLLVLAASARQYVWPTLGEELAKHGVPAVGVDDVDRRITSFGVLNDDDWFAIGYYWSQDSDLLPDTLRLRVYDKRAGTWRHAEFEGPFGSIIRLRRSGSGWLVTGHSSPSAAPTLVVSRDLALVRVLEGFPELVLPDGRVIYHANLVHFAPAHPGALRFYDPVTNRDLPLFPPNQDTKERTVDRSFESVTAGAAASTVVFSVVEQDITITPANTGKPSGPARRFSVTCRLSSPPRCTAKPEASQR